MLEGIGRFESARHGFCVVCLCQGTEKGKPFFAFVAIEPQNYNYFRKTYHQGQTANFNVFGRELLRGPGVLPPKDIIDYVRNKYDIEFDMDRRFMERLVALSTHSDTVSSAPDSPFPVKPAEARESG